MTRQSRTDTWMPLYVADYLRDTMHLSTEQHGAYFLLLMACWSRGSLPSDPAQLAGIARMPLAAWRRASPVLMPFFVVDGELVTHKRVTAERERALAITEARRAAGQKGGRPRKQEQTNSEANAFAELEQTETPARVASPSQITPPSEDGGGVGAREPEADDWPPGKATDHARLLVLQVASPWLDPSKSPGLVTTEGRLHAWRRDGATWEHDVVPVVTALSAGRNGQISTWKFFDHAIARSIAANRAALEIPAAPTRESPHERTHADAKLVARHDNYASAARGAAAAARRVREC
jgi:uncharacterized protein YdaU (DUF1376 family)